MHAPTDFEQRARGQGYRVVAGVDEAGRGPLAGPVVAVACVLSCEAPIDGVKDSKKVAPKRRGQLFSILKEQAQYGVGVVDHTVIDTINIYQATLVAMKEAVGRLSPKPDFVLVDGMVLDVGIPCEKIVKGDQRSYSIAAASILAKEIRDGMMLEYHERWPQYGFDRHKGYPTALHVESLKMWGPCPIHRRTFGPVLAVLEQ